MEEGTRQDLLETLMSILMLSARQPDGITKSDILEVLAAHGQSELFNLCEVVEYSEEPDTDAELGELEEPLAPDIPGA